MFSIHKPLYPTAALLLLSSSAANLILISISCFGLIIVSADQNVGEQQQQQEIDPNGYIAYCPCMGRFGNQADQFLGAIAFAMSLNRTLILPPWVEYIPYESGSQQIPFDTYFNVEPLQSFHRVITMETFMKELAPSIWPPEKRISFCYSERKSSKGCDAKDGNPFGPFWDKFNVEFVGSEIFGPNLHYVTYPNSKSDSSLGWKKYTGENWPVLAFVGPPSAFPVEEQNRHIQQYLTWNDHIISKAESFIKSMLPKGPFIGIHLRNGIDWSRACELVDGINEELFASPQCTGYRNKRNRSNKGSDHKLTYEMCFPSLTTILKQIKRAIKEFNATSIFIASDKHLLIDDLQNSLHKLNVQVVKLNYNSAHVDLAILGKSNYFIGNCVSSFSAFVKRERDVNGFKTGFWGYPPDPKKKRIDSEELLQADIDMVDIDKEEQHDEL